MWLKLYHLTCDLYQTHQLSLCGLLPWRQHKRHPWRTWGKAWFLLKASGRLRHSDIPWCNSRRHIVAADIQDGHQRDCQRVKLGRKCWTFHLCSKTERRIEPWHDKTNKVTVRPVKTQISLGIRPVWSVSSLSAWRKLGSLATHQAHGEDSDQTGRMPRLIWIFAGRTVTLLVLSCHGSIMKWTLKSTLNKCWETITRDNNL